MADYLKKPSIRNSVNVVRGDRLREGQNVEMHLTQPLASNTDVPEKTVDLLRVEVPDDKILAAKDKKREQVERLGLRKPSGAVGGSKLQSGNKRAGGSIFSRPEKRSKPDDDIEVVELDSTEGIANPEPIRSIPPTGLSSGGAEAGMFRRYSSVFLTFFVHSFVL